MPMAECATSIKIEASPEEVFEYLVTPDGMTAWMGQRADLDPCPDGAFHVDIAGSPIVAGTWRSIGPTGSSCPGEWRTALSFHPAHHASASP